MTEHKWVENNIKGDDDSIWDKDNQPVLEGKLTKIETGVGPNESTMYTIKQDNGEDVKVWGSTVLDDRFLGIPEGTYVRVNYEGKAKSKKGTYYHNYRVYLDEDSKPLTPPKKDTVIEDTGDEPISLQDIPF